MSQPSPCEMAEVDTELADNPEIFLKRKFLLFSRIILVSHKDKFEERVNSKPNKSIHTAEHVLPYIYTFNAQHYNATVPGPNP